MQELRKIVQSVITDSKVEGTFQKKQLKQHFITICSIIICLLTWALDVVFSFEIHANSKKKKYIYIYIYIYIYGSYQQFITN